MSERENIGLMNAKAAKNDEFYTQLHDIQRELNAYIDYDADVFRDKTVLLPCDAPEWSNFTRLFAQRFNVWGLKKLISTGYANDRKKYVYKPMVDLFDLETESEKYDATKTNSHGKIYELDRSTGGEHDLYHLQWNYLDGDGDFRSAEVCRLRDEADVIITNPPFSLFREFLKWIVDAGKKFLIIGNINCLTYKEVFALIKADKIWLGTGMGRQISGFIVPKEYELYGTEAGIDERGYRIVATNNCLWLTNLEHGRRHEPLMLMTMAENIRHSRHKEIRGVGYAKYDNYDALEVPYTDAIPDDYDGVMGVPITFLDKYSPEQFEILGDSRYHDGQNFPDDINVVNGKQLYRRILIRRRR